MVLKHLFTFTIFILFAQNAAALPAAGYKGMVATAHPLASQAGLEMLRHGGNAVDAAVAAAFALAVVEPYHSGLSGGAFALVKLQKDVQFLDFREVAPNKATEDMFAGDNALKARDGALAVAVPGAVKGYVEMQQQYGKLSLKQILKPAIHFAERGFLVDAFYQKTARVRLDVLKQDAEISNIFLLHNDVPPIGHKIVQRDLGKTLRLIAKHGSKVFYEGDIAEKIVRDNQLRGGILSLEDLKQFEVRKRQPLMGSYRGHTIATSPLPSSGGTILLTLLNAIEKLPATFAWHDPEWLRVYIEASKRAYADRQVLGDAAFIPGMDKTVLRLTAKDRELLNKEEYPKHTTHLSVIDKAGNAVSMTSTINYWWGAGFVARDTGVIMNDEMDDFASSKGVPNAYGIVGSQANVVAPKKIPLSSMTPTFVFETDTQSPLRLIVGSAGGSRIPSTVAQAIMNHFDFNADIEKALALGRVHHQHLPDKVFFENYALEPLTQQKLKALGYTLEEQGPWCMATGIAIDGKTGLRTGSHDVRGVGAALAE